MANLMKLVDVLMERDRIGYKEASDLVSQAKEDFDARLSAGESVDDICEEWFGLEPDFIEELI